jgi:DNA-binding response OmpR family regulator
MSLKDKHILLIEDDLDMQHAIRAMLEPEGCRVEIASTGPQGLAAMRRNPPDLLLLDIMLATPSEGFHIAYEMKADDVLRDIPIIMTSAIGHTMGMDFAKELGTDYVPADAFLEKPLSARVLRETVQEVLDRRRNTRDPESRHA